MKLLIAIPALNEDRSIASIIDRCLAAAPRIVAETGVTGVEVTVVSRGRPTARSRSRAAIAIGST